MNTVIVILAREDDPAARERQIVCVSHLTSEAAVNHVSPERGEAQFAQTRWAAAEAVMFNIYVSEAEQQILEKVRQTTGRLADICEFSVGVQAYDSHTGQSRSVIEGRVYHADCKKDETYRRELSGKEISRYYYCWGGRSWISYGPWLAHPRSPKFFEEPRILVREITGSGRHAIHAAYVDGDYLNYKTVLNVLLSEAARNAGYRDLFVLGVLNSAFMSWYFRRASNKLVTLTFPRISILDMKRFPLPRLDLSDPADRARHDRMVERVERMLALHKQLTAAKTAHEKTLLQRQIESTDRQIDRLVYELYGLTEAEVAVVEGSGWAVG